MSGDGASIDLSPRVGPTRSRPKWIPVAVLAVVALAVVAMTWFLVTNTQNFLEADDAVAERDDTGDKRFQLLGSPTRTTDQITADTALVGIDQYTPFTVVFDGVKVDVISEGTPPELFDKAVPVVLEGQWVEGAVPIDGYVFPDGANDGWWFAADRILVKHDNDYREERLTDAEQRGQLSGSSAGEGG